VKYVKLIKFPVPNKLMSQLERKTWVNQNFVVFPKFLCLSY